MTKSLKNLFDSQLKRPIAASVIKLVQFSIGLKYKNVHLRGNKQNHNEKEVQRFHARNPFITLDEKFSALV